MVGRIFLGLVLFSNLILSSVSFAGPYCPDALHWREEVIPGDSLEHIVETDSSQRLNYENLKVLVWNVYKGGKPGVYTSIDILTQNSDLALFQEGFLSQTFLNLMCSRQDLNWKMAKSFKNEQGIYAGVVTAGRENPVDSFYLKSPETEPFSDIHKMTLGNLYEIPGRSEKLLVLNIHGINFVPYEFFVNQINVIAKSIESHTGPVIFAGDFNTYTDSRTQYLLKKTKALGLSHAKIEGNTFNSILILDHLFYRGFEVTKAETLKHVQTSDHKPMYFELKLLK